MRITLGHGCVRRLVSRSCGGSAKGSEGLLQGVNEPWLHTWI